MDSFREWYSKSLTEENSEERGPISPIVPTAPLDVKKKKVKPEQTEKPQDKKPKEDKPLEKPEPEDIFSDSEEEVA